MDPALFQQLALGLAGGMPMQGPGPGGAGSGCCASGESAGSDAATMLQGMLLAELIAQDMLRRSSSPGQDAHRVADRGRCGSPGGRSPRRAAGDRIPRAPSEQSTPESKLRGSTDGRDVPGAPQYKPHSPEAVALFREAARLAGVPESWATSRGLHNILARESGGVVGRPNYTYGTRANDRSRWDDVHRELKNGRITARSSATGLGQLLLSNVDRYYPAGRAGIGDPLQEAAGMLRYIKARYGSPEVAWARYNTVHEGY
jgi:hypothetical protein